MTAEASILAEHHLGTAPLIISLPHVGTELPPDIAAQMTDIGRGVVDTDWNVQHLYAFARASEVSWLQPRYSRYVIDLNRPPDNQALYPGQFTTELCPTTSFDGVPLYIEAPPAPSEIERRRRRYWTPYHALLQRLIRATQERFGYALLLDAHSIRSRVPRLFEGQLPHINVGTHNGRSCAPELAARITQVLGRQSRFTHVLNGRFKGGHITRGYGAPQDQVHAVQLELAQGAYMDEQQTRFDPQHAQPLQRLLQQIVAAMLAFQPGATPRMVQR